MFPNSGILSAGVEGGSPVGQQLFTSSGTFVIPEGVTKVSIVAIGRGGSASSTRTGGGGGLSYINDYSVVDVNELKIVITSLHSLVNSANDSTICRAFSASGASGGPIGSPSATSFKGGNGLDGQSGTNRRNGAGAAGYTSDGGSSTSADSSLGGEGTSPYGGTVGGAAGGSATIDGGTYGGGAAKNGSTIGAYGSGCVRITWGEGRAFPNTNTGDF